MKQVYNALVAAAAGKPALAWLQFVEIAALDQNEAQLRIRPGHRQLEAFARSRLSQVAELLAPILGRTVRVTLASPAPANEQQEAGSPDAGGSQRGGEAVDRRQAMTLPLVRKALETFPDASIVSIESEAPAQPPPGDAPDGAETELADEDEED